MEIPEDGTKTTQEILAEAVSPEVEFDVRSMGSTGLKQWGGLVREELLPQLDGPNGIRIYREMSENDAVVFGILYAIDKIIRQCKWTVEPASGAPYDRDAADFLEGVMGDMETSWTEVISEILTMLVYGFSIHEIVYKQRGGRHANQHPAFASKFSDGRVGWRSLPIRGQDTVQKWLIDDYGAIKGVQQLAPPNFKLVDIPMSRMLLFRTSVHKNNPEGRSILRGAYRAWYYKTRIESIEAIGAERDLAGLPVAWVPPEILSPNADPKKKAVFNAVKGVVVNVRNDAQAALMMPLEYDANGKQRYDFKLMSSGGARQFDCDKIIQRYDHRIAQSMLAGFTLLGQGQSATGSFAMHSDMTKMFMLSLTAFLESIAEQFNDVAIPRLFSLNAFPVSDFPRVVPGRIEGADLGTIGTYLTALSQCGMALFPNEPLEAHLLDIAGLPSAVNEAPLDADQQVEQSAGTASPQPFDEAPVAPALGEPGQVEVVAKAGWSEEDHPRGPDGKFGEGGGGEVDTVSSAGHIGRTSSGKLIPGADHPALAEANQKKKVSDKKRVDALMAATPGWSRQDHEEAAAAHSKRDRAMGEGPSAANGWKVSDDRRMWMMHAHAAARRQ